MLTREQQLEKHILERQLYEIYSDSFKQFARKMTFELDELAIVTTTAYGVDREELFYSSVKEALETRDRALKNRPVPGQLPLFPEQEIDNVT